MNIFYCYVICCMLYLFQLDEWGELMNKLKFLYYHLMYEWTFMLWLWFSDYPILKKYYDNKSDYYYNKAIELSSKLVKE